VEDFCIFQYFFIPPIFSRQYDWDARRRVQYSLYGKNSASVQVPVSERMIGMFEEYTQASLDYMIERLLLVQLESSTIDKGKTREIHERMTRNSSTVYESGTITIQYYVPEESTEKLY